MANDQTGRSGEERFWQSVDAAALAASDEARELAREAVAQRSLSPDRFNDPLEALRGSGALSDLGLDRELLRADGLVYEPEEIERILSDYFLNQAAQEQGAELASPNALPIPLSNAASVASGSGSGDRAEAAVVAPMTSVAQAGRPERSVPHAAPLRGSPRRPRYGVMLRLTQALERWLRS